jgi:CHAT domain-containing protein
MYPQPPTVSQVQKLLDADTLLLEFTLGQERSYVLAVTATELHSYVLPPRAQIEESAQLFLKHLKAGQPVFGESAAKRKARMDLMANYWSEATALSRMLLGQVSSLSKKKNVLIVADGQLQYIPFSALPSPDFTPGVGSAGTPLQAMLVRDHEITNLPSASVLGVLRQSLRREPPSKSVAIFADPVLEKDDPRIQLAQQNRAKPAAENRKYLQQALRDIADDGETTKLGRLGASGREARQIIELTPPGSSFEALGFKANRENATSKQLGLYWAVHFATHGILNETNPERSGVVLSLYDERGRFHEEGYLRLKDIYDLNLPVELVVLSACRTGLGKPVKGEGLIGLTRGFMHAGSRRVLASLWKVDDDATAELMKRFYQKILKEGMTPTAALRAAQSSMSSESQWSHPYYWAGFVLQGEPK